MTEGFDMKFKQFIEVGPTVDYSSMPLHARMQYGRVIGEDFIRRVLREKHGIDIEPSKSYHQDAIQKIDGYWNGEPVQIKLRRSTRDDRNDIAYELVRNHNPQIPVREELKNIHSQGRDYRGHTVQHYFVLNRAETAVYHVPADNIRNAVEIALDELEMYDQGILGRPFTASTNGVQLRPTRDPDPNSFTPSKVMAFIPVERVSDKTYDITEQPKQVTAGAQQPLPTPPPPPAPKSMSDLAASLRPKKVPSLGNKLQKI